MDVNRPSKQQLETGYVIEQTNRIETLLKRIICSYFDLTDHNKNTFLLNTILNNQIINLSSKVKIYKKLNKLNSWPEFSNNKFDKILNFRNAFAHNDINQLDAIVSATGCNNGDVVDSYIFLASVSSSGELKKVNRQDALNDFIGVYNEISTHLNEVLLILEKNYIINKIE